MTHLEDMQALIAHIRQHIPLEGPDTVLDGPIPIQGLYVGKCPFHLGYEWCYPDFFVDPTVHPNSLRVWFYCTRCKASGWTIEEFDALMNSKKRKV
jgi:hypothetical protein